MFHYLYIHSQNNRVSQKKLEKNYSEMFHCMAIMQGLTVETAESTQSRSLWPTTVKGVHFHCFMSEIESEKMQCFVLVNNTLSYEIL